MVLKGKRHAGSQTRYELNGTVHLGPQIIFPGASQGSSNRKGRVLERLKSKGMEGGAEE